MRRTLSGWRWRRRQWISSISASHTGRDAECQRGRFRLRPNERRHVDPAIVELRPWTNTDGCTVQGMDNLFATRHPEVLARPASLDGIFTFQPRMQACPRAVQFTPPGSPTSIHLGTGPALPHYLVVNDLEAARAELISSGVDVSEVFHRGPKGRIPENWRSCGRHSEQDHALSRRPRESGKLSPISCTPTG